MPKGANAGSVETSSNLVTAEQWPIKASPGFPAGRAPEWNGGSAAECWVDRPLHATEALAFQPLRPEKSHAHR